MCVCEREKEHTQNLAGVGSHTEVSPGMVPTGGLWKALSAPAQASKAWVSEVCLWLCRRGKTPRRWWVCEGRGRGPLTLTSNPAGQGCQGPGEFPAGSSLGPAPRWVLGWFSSKAVWSRWGLGPGAGLPPRHSKLARHSGDWRLGKLSPPLSWGHRGAEQGRQRGCTCLLPGSPRRWLSHCWAGPSGPGQFWGVPPPSAGPRIPGT